MKQSKTKEKRSAPRNKRPVKRADGKSKLVPATSLQPADVIPGELLPASGDIVAFPGRATVTLIIANTGDRPIQVGSHCHFFEANRALRFDRERAFGFRLQIPAGTAVRFEPGEEKQVSLVAIGGNRAVYGINGLTNGRLDDPAVREQALTRAKELGFI